MVSVLIFTQAFPFSYLLTSYNNSSEYVYEGQEWDNGVFTYSLIQTLDEKGYESGRGQVGVPVSTLQKEVYKKVNNLTNGKQKPTARTENPEWDWEL